MTKFIVMGIAADGEWKGFGSHEFSTPPRKGEYVSWDDEEGTGQTYEVIAVIHPLEPTATSGDLIVRYVSIHTTFINDLRERYS